MAARKKSERLEVTFSTALSIPLNEEERNCFYGCNGYYISCPGYFSLKQYYEKGGNGNDRC